MAKTTNRTLADTSHAIFWMNTLLYRGRLSDKFMKKLQKEKDKLLAQERQMVAGLPTLVQYRHQIERANYIVSAAEQIKEKVSESVKWYTKRLKKVEKKLSRYAVKHERPRQLPKEES